jgi:hypothetical protein
VSRLDRILGWLIFLVALTVYARTLTPSLSYLSPDGSELATVPYILGLAHSPGYPLYTWLGFVFARAIPFGDVAGRINWMSAVMGALAAESVFSRIPNRSEKVPKEIHFFARPDLFPSVSPYQAGQERTGE